MIPRLTLMTSLATCQQLSIPLEQDPESGNFQTTIFMSSLKKELKIVPDTTMSYLMINSVDSLYDATKSYSSF